MVVGGAKGLLRGYLVEGGGHLRAAWSPTLPSAGEAAGDDGDERLEERVMAVDALRLAGGALAVVAATSGGVVHRWDLDADAPRFAEMQRGALWMCLGSAPG